MYILENNVRDLRKHNKCFIFIKGLKLINYRVRRVEILITFTIIFLYLHVLFAAKKYACYLIPLSLTKFICLS